MQAKLLGVYTLSLFMSSTLFAMEDMDLLEIQERIAPVGKVRIEKSPSETNKTEQIKTTSTQKRSGQDIYEQYCIICHRDGLAGAPKFQNESEWKPRLAGKTIDEIVQIAITGLNAMPPKGTCMDCSDEELKTTIQYMLPK
jgi:cytochrome c5